MSMLRKTAVTVAIAGAGLGSLSGAAFANTSHGHDSHGKHSHDHSGSCTNDIEALNESKGHGPVDVAGGAQTLAPINACDILNHNMIANGNTITVAGTTTTLPAAPEVPDLGSDAPSTDSPVPTDTVPTDTPT